MCAVVAALSLLALAGVAAAQPPGDAATAQALFDEAKALMDRDEHAAACPKLEESQRLDPGPGTLFHLASCYENIGRTASAWAAYLEVAGAARAAGRSAHEALARERAAALAPRLSRLRLLVSPDVPSDTTIERDGIELGRGAWSANVPVDPGVHRVRATSSSTLPWEGRVEVRGEGRTVTLSVPPLVPRRTRGASELGEAARAGAEDQGTGAEGRGAGPRGAIALGAAAVGVVAAGAGTYFGLRAITLDDRSAAHCSGNTCDARGVTLRDDAMSAGTTSPVLFVGAGVALAASLVLWLTTPRGPALARSGR
jgi:hypothetical protein